jgi:hypothetical protein
MKDKQLTKEQQINIEKVFNKVMSKYKETIIKLQNA